MRVETNADFLFFFFLLFVSLFLIMLLVLLLLLLLLLFTVFVFVFAMMMAVVVDFGNARWQGNTGANPNNDPEGEDGPWVGADLECGMYYGGGKETKVNNRSLPLKHPFVTLYLRGRTQGMVLKGGDATKGGANNSLITMFDGERPDCAIADTCNRHRDQGGCNLGPDGNCTYQPPKKQVNLRSHRFNWSASLLIG